MKIRYVTWRNGRPRFNPSPELRLEGYKGKDLKHDDGRWFDAAAAKAWSDEFVAKRPLWPGSRSRAGAPRKTHILQDRKGDGFVYFLMAGDLLKVGFSSQPIARAAQIMQGIGQPLRLFVVVPGTKADERRLLQRLHFHRTRGEWFKAVPKALEVISMELEIALTVTTA